MKTLFGIMLVLCTMLPALAQETPMTVPIWPHLAPGETTANPGRVTDDHSGNITRITDVTAPQMLVFRPEHLSHAPAVLVFPGGGYGILALDLEGTEVARWLNSLGFVAAVLEYRVPNNRNGAFQDAQRAMSVLRARAKQYGIDPRRVGVLGFSAGGHLAARIAASSGERTYTAVDKADHSKFLPDFALLIYPAYLIDAATGQPAPEVMPHVGMPPLFLAQTRDDPYLDAPVYAAALEKDGVATTCVLYDTGGHGYGLRLPQTQPAHAWADEAAKWLRQFEDRKK